MMERIEASRPQDIWELPPPIRVGVALLLMVALGGCSRGEQQAAESATDSTGAPSAGESPQAGAKLLDEAWEIHFIEAQRVGHGSLKTEQISEDGRLLTRITGTTELAVRRFGSLISQKVALVSVESSDGALSRFETRVYEGTEVTMATLGRYENGRLSIETTTLGKTVASSMPWGAKDGGLFADRESLRRKPMKPGERRKIIGLVPVLTQPGEITLVAEQPEVTQLPEGPRELLRIRGKLEIGGKPEILGTIESIYWADKTGDILKTTTSFSGFEQTAYRATKAEALRISAPADFDLGTRSTVKIARVISDPHQARRIRYRVRMSAGNPAEIFAAGPTQAVRSIDAATAEVTVTAVRPDQPPASASPPAGPSDLAANNLIQSDDPLIVEMARGVLPHETDAWRVARALEGMVRQLVTSHDLSQALASAAEVARTHEGDCTEHAVLLAALCRARGIPARVAAGLIYSPAAGGFAYHMWNLVFVSGRWVPLDATLGLGGIGAAHLTILTSDFAGATPYGALLPVLDVLGKLEIEIVSVE